MKILQVVKTNRGAAWAFNQAKFLSGLGVEIITVLPNVSEGYAQQYTQAGLPIIQGDWRLPIGNPFALFRICNEIRRVVNQIQPDLIHLHFVTNAIMCRLALRKDKTPRLFQVPGPLHLENPVTSFVERICASAADYWAGACRKTVSVYLSKGVPPERVFLAYYGIPSKEDAHKESKEVLSSEYNVPKDALVIAMVSYFYKPKRYLGQKRGLKGHEDFIDAMKIVLGRHPNVVPVIVGNAWDGAEEYEYRVRKYANKILGDKVVFTGYRDDIYDLYPEIDIVVHPSHSENLGGAAESLMLAVPTISTDVGGFPDIVVPGKTGCIAKAKSPQDLSEKIIWAIEHLSEMKNMAITGQEVVNDLLALERTSKAVFDIYSKILQQC